MTKIIQREYAGGHTLQLTFSDGIIGIWGCRPFTHFTRHIANYASARRPRRVCPRLHRIGRAGLAQGFGTRPVDIVGSAQQGWAVGAGS